MVSARIELLIHARAKTRIRFAGGGNAKAVTSDLRLTSGSTRSPTWWSRKTGGERSSVAAVKPEQIVDETEAYVVESPERERPTSEVGELIMSRLKAIDTVAYIRFASVYRDFKDVREFKAELEELLDGRDPKKRR